MSWVNPSDHHKVDVLACKGRGVHGCGWTRESTD